MRSTLPNCGGSLQAVGESAIRLAQIPVLPRAASNMKTRRSAQSYITVSATSEKTHVNPVWGPADRPGSKKRNSGNIHVNPVRKAGRPAVAVFAPGVAVFAPGVAVFAPRSAVA